MLPVPPISSKEQLTLMETSKVYNKYKTDSGMQHWHALRKDHEDEVFLRENILYFV